MRTFFLLFFVSLSLVCFSDLPSTGNGEVDEYLYEIDQHLTSIDSHAETLYNGVNNYYYSALHYYQWITQNDDGTSYYTGMKTAAQRLLEDINSMVSLVRANDNSVEDDLGVARSALVQVASRWSSNVSSNDLSAILEEIENFHQSTDFRLDTVITNQLYSISNLQVMVSILRSVFPPSTNGVGQAVNDLSGSVNQLCIDFAHFWVYANNLLDWMNDEDEMFKQFFTIAVERLESPDFQCQAALRDMWNDLLSNRHLLYSATNQSLYSIDQQVSIVLQQIDPNVFRLSNEGVIALENLAVNERSYLCLAELVNRPVPNTTISNSFDLAWITNYLGKIQQPYYDNFNNAFGPVARFDPYQKSKYDAFTNLFEVASSDATTVQRVVAYSLYQQKVTNFWERLETYMLSMNGLMGVAPLADDEEERGLNSNFDSENITRSIDYSTNAFSNVVSDYASVSNSLNVLTRKFKTLMDSFTFQGGSGGQLTLCPDFQLGGIQFEAVRVDAGEWSTITVFCSNVFSVIWYSIFTIIGFKMVLYIVFLLGRTIAHMVLVISTLLS